MLAEDSSRLEKIDKLYELRLDRYVDLPMLVVVGDQSSGKSSVLEALTGLPFPRDSGLCTRFPTQVVFRRATQRNIDISIIPCDAGPGFTGPGTAPFSTSKFDELTGAQFNGVLLEACRFMGVPSREDVTDSDSKSFSKDTLKIELSGPEYEHFSVVDLPGLFRKPTLGKTTKDDISFVRDMVRTYLQNSRCIILAVVPANVDIATQEIVQMAEDADLEGKRTLGVLTKPDLVDKGAEDKVLELISGHGGRFGLGYTIICNRSQSNLGQTLAQRNTSEKDFFQHEPWISIPKHRVGIKALKTRLNRYLVDLARETFDGVARDISLTIDRCHMQLRTLGPERSNKIEQRSHLLKISTTFQALTSHALDAYYGRDECFRLYKELRLATIIKSLQEDFSRIMRKEGHTYSFRQHEADATDDATGPTEPLESSENSSDSEEFSPEELEEDKMGVVNESPQSKAELLRELRPVCTNPPAPSDKPSEPITIWIRREYNRSKGFEIGTVNPSLLPVLYHEQIKYWRYYAMEHINKVILATHSFITTLLDYICFDAAIRESFQARLIPLVLDSYEKAIRHVELLLKVEELGNLRTLNHYFAITLKKMRFTRTQKRFEKLTTFVTNDVKKDTLLRLSDVLDAHISNDDQVVEDLHDILRSYYKVARKQFVDAVSKGAVDYLLLTVSDGPLRFCSPEFVGTLSDDDLEKIAAESEESSRERSKIVRELTALQTAQKILR